MGLTGTEGSGALEGGLGIRHIGSIRWLLPALLLRRSNNPLILLFTVALLSGSYMGAEDEQINHFFAT